MNLGLPFAPSYHVGLGTLESREVRPVLPGSLHAGRGADLIWTIVPKDAVMP